MSASAILEQLELQGASFQLKQAWVPHPLFQFFQLLTDKFTLFFQTDFSR